MFKKYAVVAEQVDALDLKSNGPKGSCRFDSGQQYKNLKTIYLYKMKKVLFIAALVTLASCSNSTTTSSTDSTCKDSTCMDSTNIDSLIDSVDAHADTLSVLLKK